MTAFLIGRTSEYSEASLLGRGQCDLSPFKLVSLCVVLLSSSLVLVTFR